MEEEVSIGKSENADFISLKEAINYLAENFKKVSEKTPVHVISHFDTDGITSASIITKCLQREDVEFDLTILKSLTPEIISTLPKEGILFFLDLASNSLDTLATLNQQVFILDHHEISQEIPENVTIANPRLQESNEEISSAGLCYLFAKKISLENKDLAPLAIVGMVGDSIETISLNNSEIARDSEVLIKKGLLIYPSTRPINRALEFSSSPYIPGVTGDREGVIQLLRDAKIEREDGKYKNLIDLNEEEMTRIVTAIMLKTMKKSEEGIIGNIFLIKQFNQLEDARELSAKINATSRLGEPYKAVLYCLGQAEAKKNVENMYAQYKQFIISGLKKVERLEKAEGKGYLIINAKNEISDAIIGVIASILSHSSVYEEGTIIVAMSYSEEKKIKVSGRAVGKTNRNLREIFERVTLNIGGEFGGHPQAAGCIIDLMREQEFIETIKKSLEIELVKINPNSSNPQESQSQNL